jgi:hypothetical protein
MIGTMERRIRLTWSPKDLRPWCPGASLPPARSGADGAGGLGGLGAAGRTGFMRVQGLMERIRRRRVAARAHEQPGASPEPAAPLPVRPPRGTVPEVGQRDAAR